MDRLLLPASAGIITSMAAAKIWSKGYKDIGFLLGLGTAAIGYFCVFDYQRARDPEYKSKLIATRKKEFEMLNHRPIVDLLESIVQRHRSISVLKDPRSNQQLMMQYVQRGEQQIQTGDKTEGVKFFAIAAAIQYIGAGEGKAQQLVDTVCSMLPGLTDSIVDNFKKDKKAVDDFIKKEESKNAPLLQSREDFFKNLQKQSPKIEEVEESELVEDPIDESESSNNDEEPIKEPEPKVEPAVIEESNVDVSDNVDEPLATEDVTQPEETEDVTEVIEDVVESEPAQAPATPPPTVEEVQEEIRELHSSPEIITSEEVKEVTLTEETNDLIEDNGVVDKTPEEGDQTVIVREVVGDAPQIKKIVVNDEEQMVDEELE